MLRGGPGGDPGGEVVRRASQGDAPTLAAPLRLQDPGLGFWQVAATQRPAQAPELFRQQDRVGHKVVARGEQAPHAQQAPCHALLPRQLVDAGHVISKLGGGRVRLQAVSIALGWQQCRARGRGAAQHLLMRHVSPRAKEELGVSVRAAETLIIHGHEAHLQALHAEPELLAPGSVSPHNIGISRALHHSPAHRLNHAPHCVGEQGVKASDRHSPVPSSTTVQRCWVPVPGIAASEAGCRPGAHALQHDLSQPQKPPLKKGTPAYLLGTLCPKKWRSVWGGKWVRWLCRSQSAWVWRLLPTPAAGLGQRDQWAPHRCTTALPLPPRP